MFVTPIVSALSFLVCVYIYQKWSRYSAFRTAAAKYSCHRPRRYPHTEPFWGYDLVRKLAKAARKGQQSELYEELFRQNGKTFENRLFTTNVINTMDSANIQTVATSSFQDYAKSSEGERFLKPAFGRGVFTTDGAAWKHSRNLIRPIFSRSDMSDLNYLGPFIDRLFEKIPRDGSTFDLQPLSHKLGLDIATDSVFGQSVDSLLIETPFESFQFVKSFNAMLAGTGKRKRFGKLASLRFAFDTEWKKAYTEIHDWVDVQVKRALQETEDESQLSSEKGAKSEESSPQPRYILLYEMAKQIRDPVELRFQTLQVFLPAANTSPLILANCLFYLARKPEIWTKLRQDALALGDQPLTFELLRTLIYFRHVFWETLRVRGLSSPIVREAIRDTVLPVGGGPDGLSPIFVAKGTEVAMHIRGQGHDTDFWGEDVHTFRPERFTDRRILWQWVPFFGGPRICLANQQVQTQFLYELVRLVREFERIENRDECIEYIETTNPLMKSKNGVKIALFPA
ncbi:hypothetical protein G7Y89_g2873 [Cudoniella acicularis]|uniref:Cytochrome P450 n=1 Tax=Cudoniella acicularis TaxID=354080 RepID=A0A8H4RTR9_9HELO|nr:hypothetical protein G7Y89_g2873 [Cudoniella acicularis]